MSVISKAMDAAKKYTVWDYGILKITLLSAGILLGTYFAYFFSCYISVIWIIFIICFVWIVYRTFVKHMK